MCASTQTCGPSALRVRALSRSNCDGSGFLPVLQAAGAGERGDAGDPFSPVSPPTVFQSACRARPPWLSELPRRCKSISTPKNLRALPLGGYVGAAALGLALLVGALAWRFVTPTALFTSVNHTRDVLSAIEDVRVNISRAESRQWAYFITRDPAFLVERTLSLDAVKPGLNMLVGLTADNPGQQVLLKSLEVSIDRRLALLAQSLQLFDSEGSGGTSAAVRAGRVAADEVLTLLRQAEEVEGGLLTTRKTAEVARWLTATAVMVLLLAGLAGLAVVGLRARKNSSKRLQEETAVSEARTALIEVGALQDAIFNSANFSSIATDASGVIQIFNVGAERMLGYKAAEVVDKITPAGISDAQELIVRATALSAELKVSITPGFEALVFKASRGIEDIYELTYIRKDGSRFPAIVSVTALRNDADKVIGYLLIGTDNTARKAAEEALLRAGALQAAIFNSANFSSIATDAQGVIQIFNVGAERMLGYHAVDVVNKITPAGISDEQELLVRAAALSAELETPITPGFEALVFKASRGIEDIYELTYIRKDGSRFPAVVSVTALRDDQGEVIGYLLIGTDNTARKQVEAEQALLDQRLRDQQFYTRSLIESNIDALMTTDPRGIITDVNEQMAVLTGCTRDELIGAPFRGFFTDPLRAQNAIARVLAEGKVTNYELTAQARDGARTVVSCNATTFNDRDRKLQGVFASARDITERKQFERTLQENNLELEKATAAAEKANRAKSDFLSSMSHELRTPLNAILGFAQLVETGSPPPTPAQKESVDQILSSGWYLLELINEILDLALIESGRLTLSTEPVSVSEVIQECQAMIEPQALKRDIGMAFPRFEAPCFVKADRTRIKQVLINLLFNAVKYNRVSGTVTVEYRKSAADALRVSVRDTGLGLTPEQLGQLFQPFNRLGKENSAEEGTGIGLVVTKRLIEMMGGTLGAESVVDVGSVFWFELPLSAAPHATLHDFEQATLTPPPQPLGTPLRTVLYVEDNIANLKLMERLFARRTDLSLLVATDGHAGVALARARQPQVILMDINLPGLSGTEALRALRADPATAHITVIAVSANAVPGDIKRSLEAGFYSYITKPIKLNQLMASLDAALQLAQPPIRPASEPAPEQT